MKIILLYSLELSLNSNNKFRDGERERENLLNICSWSHEQNKKRVVDTIGVSDAHVKIK